MGVSQNSIGAICPTIGRKSLEITIKSFLAQKLIPNDRLFIIGDGWYESWIQEFLIDSRIKFAKSKKVGNFGHPLINYILSIIETDYVWTFNDDDAWLPGSWERIRLYLDGSQMVCNTALDEKGNICKHYFAPNGTKTINRPVFGGLTPVIPNKKPFYLLGSSDGKFFRAEATKSPLKFLSEPAVLWWAPLASANVWEKTKMNEICSWRDEFKSWREPKREYDSYEWRIPD